MGRTTPSFRIAEAQEIQEWRSFRRALSKEDRRVFDEMLNSARLYASASSAAVRTSRFEGMAMAIAFHQFKMLAEVRRRPVSLSDKEIVEEVQSWRGFGDALKAEDRELFTEMLRQCYEYIPSMHAKESPFSAEALLMSILFAQHKMIARLAKELKEKKTAVV